MQNTQEPALLPIKAAALKVGLSYKILLEAVNEGCVPYYQLGRSRRLLKVSDILACMKSMRTQEHAHE